MLHSLMHHPVMQKLRTMNSSDLGKLALRLAAGGIFLYHGQMKLFGGMAMTTAFFGKIGIPAPEFFAPFVGCVEFVGGIMLILGLCTRLFGLMLTVDMFVAIVATKHYMAWKSAEFELILLASSLTLFLSGAGAWSLDALLMKKMSSQHAAAMPVPPRV